MAWESSGALIAGATGMAGILATYLTARYSSKINLRVMEIEHRYRIVQTTIAERKAAYVKILHAFEEFDFTLSALHKIGYGRSIITGPAGLTQEVHELLTRNLKVDLAIQNVERELELIAPLDVIKACRRTFRALREQTSNLTNYGDLSTEPYCSFLATTVARMRADLNGTKFDFIEDMERDMRSIYDLNAPESAIKLRLDLENGQRTMGASQPPS